MDSLQGRLRDPYNGFHTRNCGGALKPNACLICQAADALDAKDAEIAYLKACLRGIADYPYAFGQHVQTIKGKAALALAKGGE